MSRRTVLAVLTGAVLVAGLNAPALADPLEPVQRTIVCVRLDPEGDRGGFCVWVPTAER